MQHIYLLFFGLLFTAQAYCQQQLRVINQRSAEGIPEVFIYSFKNNFNALSDENGYFEVPKHLLNDTLFAQHPSFHTEKIIVSNHQLNNNIHLKEKLVNLDEILISVSKSSNKKKEVPNQVHIISLKTLEMMSSSTAADILQQTGAAYVQKSQSGGGSPILRGFEANKVLLIYDGLRMNNAIYRSGHLQNAISIDQNTLAATEVIYGPGSVIYGSDALGGVIHYISEDPETSKSDNTAYQTNYLLRTSSANKEKTVSINLAMSLKKIAALTSVTYSSFEDLQAGKKQLTLYPDFARLPYYYQRINNQDSTVLNESPYYQKNTSYSQLNYLQKYTIKINKNTFHKLKLYHSTSSNIPRYDRLNDLSDGNMKFAEWHYGPQSWTIIQHRFIKDSIQSVFANHIQTSLAMQHLNESRITRKFQNLIRTVKQESIKVYSLNIDLEKNIKSNKLSYGIDYHYNKVLSTAYTQNINSNLSSPTITRYPNGGSSYLTAALYSYFQTTFNQKWDAHFGIRFNAVQSYLNFLKDDALNESVYANYSNTALTGSSGFHFHPNKNNRFKFILSTGFRAPNIDDLGKMFETNDGHVVVPNIDLKSEYLYNSEISYENEALLNFRWEVGYFQSLINNVIVRKPFIFEGSNYLFYNDELRLVEANQNSDQGFINGLHFNFKGYFSKSFSIKGNYNITKGIDLTNKEALSHIPPHYATLHLNHSSGKFRQGFWSLYNGWKRISDYGQGSTDKPEEATIDGTPSYILFNYDLAYTPSEQLTIIFQIENIFDQLYKPFASGVAGGGRNFRITLRTQL